MQVKWFSSSTAPKLNANVVVKTDKQETVGRFVVENLCGEGVLKRGSHELDTVYCRNVMVWKLDNCTRIGNHIVKRLTKDREFMWRYLEDEGETDGNYAL